MIVWLVPCFLRAQATDVLTYHNDNARTGQTLHEEILTPANVNQAHFGKLRMLSTDGKIDAQPLYAAGIQIPGMGMRNVLFVASEHDTLYAFDADSGQVLWRASLLGAGETPSDDRGCSQVTPEIGITATPVIDRSLGTNGTIFVVAMSKNSSRQYFQRLHALDLSTGSPLMPSVTITATFPGTGSHSSGGNVIFDPAQYKERPGLLLFGSVIYTTWSSHCDFQPYTGWIMAFDEHTLAQSSVLDITPNGSEGAFWMSGTAPAADSSGNIYALAANGTFDVKLDASGFPSKHDFGNAFLKIATTNHSLTPVDYFAPNNTPVENGRDEDLGSGGALVLPDLTDDQGHTRQLAVGAGKDSNIYLVDRTNLGKFNPTNNNAIYQEVSGALAGQGVYSMPAYFQGVLYYGAVGDRLKAFPFQNARLGAASSRTSMVFPYPGCTPSVSANGTTNGIVWAAENGSTAVLHAYNATNLALELYNSNQATNGRDHFGQGNKFITPTVASARVYVGTTSGVGVFGLLDQTTLTPLQTWRDNHFGNPSNVGTGADGASPSGDGVPNLVKCALGLDPLQAVVAGQLPTGTVQPDQGQNYLTLTVKRAARLPDVSYTVEVSTDLVAWVSGGTNTVTLTNTPNQLVVRDATPVTAAPHRFMRLRVQSLPEGSGLAIRSSVLRSLRPLTTAR